MAGIFDGVDSNATVNEESDRVKGQKQQPLDSDIYNLIVVHAFAKKSTGGAMGVHVLLKNEEGREIKMTEYITSGDKKGNKTFYEKQVDGKTEQFNLPGFTMIDNLCQLTTGKSVLALGSEKRTIKLYDFDAKADKPTEVDMLIDLVGKPVCGCVLHQIEDKTKKNDVSGEYEPTGATYATNVINKFLDPQGRKTAIEVAKGLNADFQTTWLEKWKGEINDESTEVKGAGNAGAPAATGAGATKAPLFAN